MQTIELAIERRGPTGKGAARKLRDTNRIPAVFYGPGRATELLTLDPKDVRPLVGHTFLLKFKADGDELDGQLGMLRDVQRDPVSRQLLHADIYEVQMGRELTLIVPLEFVGLAKGVDNDGGTLDIHLRELEIRCLPRHIPAAIEVEVSPLGIGDVLHIGELTLPEGVSPTAGGALAVAAVAAPLVEAAATPEEGAEEPAEDAKEKKDDEKEKEGEG